MKMQFQQRHYEFLARFFRREYDLSLGFAGNPNLRTDSIRSLARLLASELSHDNSKFDRDRFLNAAIDERITK